MIEEQLTMVSKFLETKLSGELMLLEATRKKVLALESSVSAIEARFDVLCSNAVSYEDFACLSKHSTWSTDLRKSLVNRHGELCLEYSACLKRVKKASSRRDAIHDFILQQSRAAKSQKRSKAERLLHVDDS